ncbi:MAG: AsmA-like C-terminal domain-containing protein [Desulfobulbaceae bacterium]|nr:AsmA-like C-terminal domain-containing protein [Desulfobulbaceae bacterium]HIJ91412.1 AsmA family protein [Deltaproteobacteria bacterium]
MNLPRISNLRLRTRIILACAVFVLLGVIGPALLLEHLIDLEALKTRMCAQVNAKLEGDLQTDRLQWVWLPLPHLKLGNTRFTSEETALVVPMAKVYPDWASLWHGQIRIGKVLLLNPEIKIKRFPAALSESPDTELAGLNVVIRNGSLQVAANNQWTALQSKDFSMTGLNGSVAVTLAAVDFDLSGKPAAGERLAVSGKYLRDNESYRFKFACRKFNLHEAFHSFAQGTLVPGDSPLNLTGTLDGRGLEIISGKIQGDSPCFLAYPKDKKILLNCGVVDLTFAKDGDDLRLTLNEFEMLEPGLKLAGTVRRSPGRTANSAPVWEIDLTGEQLDMTRIRAAVLAVWGENEIVKEVGKIVQGGTVGKAGYSFHGTAADLEYVRNMHITAEDIDAAVMIPEGELLLTEAKGKIQIENGLLIVDADQARMGNSRGKNGRLILGLPDDDFTFKLDVDLDADLAELPGVLGRLVDHQPFLTELARFSGVSGRATGHLHLGDHLKDFQVALKVATMQGKGRYAPLAWDFAVDGGEMTIAPPLVQWRNVRGAYGPHVVKKTAGQVRWPDDIHLAITQLDAVLSAKELEKEDLSYFKEISGVLHENITGADGRIELRNTTISGKTSEPKQWQAAADVFVQNLNLETPFFPEPIRIKQGKSHFSTKDITISEATGSIFGDSFTLGASLSHQTFSALRGKISLKGKVGQGLGQWLKEKHLIAPSLFPQLPCQVESLLIDLQEGKTYAKGVIRSEGAIFNPPKVDFSLEFTKEDPLKMAAHIYGGKEEATITLDFLDNTRETFLFSWKGELSKQTVDQLLDRKNLLQGRIAGDFQLHLPHDPNKVAFSGELEATDLRLFLDEEAERFLDIRELRLAGVGKDLKVRRLACAFNDREAVVVNGLVSRVADGLELKLDLASQALSRKTLLDFQESLKRIRDRTGKPAAPEDSPQAPPWNITGTVAFAVDEFTSGYKPGESAGSAGLLWQPLKGTITIHPQWRFSALISNGHLCCLDTTGEWFSTPELGTNHFSLRSACPTSPRFETVLPCLGYPQDIIEGEVSLTGSLAGGLDHWQDGNLQIESHQGRILRMKLLSKIFSVVNITDLFSMIQEGDGPTKSTKGFPYTDLLFKAHVKDNEMIIDEAVVRGEGLNLFARGKMNLSTFDLDVVVMISPFKTLDAIVSKVPLIGKIIGGETATLITFPVGVTGKASDPRVTLLPPSAVGEGLVNMIKRTLLLPFYIFSPMLPDAAPEPEPEKTP